MQRGRHILQRTKYNSPVIAIMLNKKESSNVITRPPKSRTRKKRFGIFTKKGDEKYEH